MVSQVTIYDMLLLESNTFARLIINNSLDEGSQIPYIKKALDVCI